MFMVTGAKARAMKSVRQALRQGDLEKDTYERISCADCEKPLGTTNDPDRVENIRTCPDCGSEYKELR